MMFQIDENRIYMNDEEGNEIAYILFPETEEGVFTIERTFVDDSLRGQGIASSLVRAAVEEIKKKGGEIKATCSYAEKWLEKHSSDI